MISSHKALGLAVLSLIILVSGILLPAQVFAQEYTDIGSAGFTPTIEDFLAAFAMLADVVGEGLVAISLGWALKPAGIGFLVGMVLLIAFRTVAPVSFEVESLTIVARIAKRKWHVMIYAVILAGIVGVLLGVFGLMGAIVDFIGPAVQYGMMAGVGIILAVVAIDLLKENKIIGYGAPAKATTALNFFGISNEIDYIVEDNKLKNNKRNFEIETNKIKNQCMHDILTLIIINNHVNQEINIPFSTPPG